MAICTRETTATGVVCKGSALTNAELDNNWVEIAGNTIYSATNCNTTAGEWGASIPSVSCYYDGLTVSFWPNCVAGKGAGTCFEINNLGAKNIIRPSNNTCNFTTHYHCTNLIFLRYEAATDKWRVHADCNTTHDYNVRWNNYVTANNIAGTGTAWHGYQLVIEGVDGKFYPVTEGGSTGNTNTVSTVELRVGGTILLYENSANKTAGSEANNVYESLRTTRMHYWNNRDSGWATDNKSVYLVATKNSNGNFVLDNTSYTSFLTQDLPTSDDGKYYIKIGWMDNTDAHFRLEINHPIYIYKNGAIREWGGYASNADQLDGNEATAFATCTQGSKADTAYGWGDHSLAGYCTTDNNTEYTAGTNLCLNNTEFNVCGTVNDSSCLGGAAANKYARVDCANTFDEKQTFTSNINICGQNGTTTCDHIITFGKESDLGCNTLAGGAQIGFGACTVPFSNPVRYVGNVHICNQAGICIGKCDNVTSGGCFALMVEHVGTMSYAWHRVRGWQSGTPGYTTFSAPSCSNSVYGFETPKGLISCDRFHLDGCGCATSTCYFCAPILCATTCACLDQIKFVNNIVCTYNTPLCLHSNCAVKLNKACINDYCLPASDGSAGQFVCTDGNGNLAFGNVSGGGGSSLSVEDEGSLLSTAATTINFVGKNVTASGTGTTKTVCAHGDTVCITSGCFYSANSVSFALSSGWQSAELMFQADCRFPMCYFPSEPRLDSLQLRRYTNCCTVFDYAANTTNNSSGCRIYNNAPDIFPDVYIADETVLRYHFWKVPMGTNNTCSRIYFEASYVGGCHGNASTARCDRVFLSGRSDTIITPTSDTGWCIYLCAGAHYIVQGGISCYCTSYMRNAEWALKVIT